YAADNGADVVSMSIGAPISSEAATDLALQYAYESGVIMVSSSGNENNDTINYPVISQYVISVGAASPCGERKRSSARRNECNPGVTPDPNDYTCDGERWWGSNYGSTTQDAADAVDILGPTILPTTDITGAGGYDPGDYDSFFNGTSCSSPYVAGVCALIKSANPTWTPAQIRAQLLNSAADVISIESAAGWDRYSGYGMVDAAAAVDAGTGPLPPVAELTSSTESGCAPLSVDFTDLSTGEISGWVWDFGDGASSTEQNPGHTFTDAGSFTVALEVTGPGGSDTFELPDPIVVLESVAGDFEASTTFGAAALSVTFTDLSTGDPDSWLWSFGDGQTDNLQSPTHIYLEPGEYEVVLTAGNGCSSDVVTRTDCVIVNGYSAVEAGMPVRFGLEQNFPNPFNPSTTIAFSLERPGHACLEIFDSAGRRIEVLVDRELAAGGHETVWRADRHASGVYFARLHAGDQTATTRLVLLK
ncbi:MAG: PKD domain-containing protein, partial [Gemmatimonadales bacterium]